MEFKHTCFLDAPAHAKGEEQASAVFQTHLKPFFLTVFAKKAIKHSGGA